MGKAAAGREHSGGKRGGKRAGERGGEERVRAWMTQ